MIDPMTSLAFSVYSGKGVYAVLLGSGVSRAAGVMTGWEVVLDLVRRSARAGGQDCGDDPAAWYEATHGAEPDYSELLGELAGTAADRGRLLRGYFEPTEDERDQGKKVPTAAHRAVARLAAGGYVRVVVTTNFDRLTEAALREVGVEPEVIASPDAAAGAPPLAHCRCAVVKVHGDYLDTRLKNTRGELSAYDPRLDRLLDQVFDEYGLIVCGWSAAWDVALRAAIERCPNRRFTTYWSALVDVTEEAKGLCELRQARVVTGRDADAFFGGLAEAVESLADRDAGHPLDAAVAAGSAKRYLAEDRHRIRLSDLLNGEVVKVEASVAAEARRLSPGPWTPEAGLPRVGSAAEAAVGAFAAGGRFGLPKHRGPFLRALERLGQAHVVYRGMDRLTALAFYPAVLSVFAYGLGAFAEGRYGNLRAVLTRPKVMVRPGHGGPGWSKTLWSVYEGLCQKKDLVNLLPVESRGGFMPFSSHLCRTLHGPFRDLFPSDDHFREVFARFEYTAALVASYALPAGAAPEDMYGPPGLFSNTNGPAEALEAEVSELGDRHPLLRAGLFGGSAAKLGLTKSNFDKGCLNRAMRKDW